MCKTLIILGFFVLGTSGFAQIYEEYFTDGNLTLNWFDAWGTGDNITVSSFPGNPSGDGWVGNLTNAASYVATALAGTLNLTDYSIYANVYFTVTPVGLGPYQGIVARWDTTNNKYYSLITDFDSDEKIRLAACVGASVTPLKVWIGDSIPGGVPGTSGWHEIGIKMIGDSIWAYYDGNLLSGSPFINTTSSSGFFGVYVFRMAGVDSIICDDIIVYEEAVGIEEMSEDSPAANILLKAAPTPFATEMDIHYLIPRNTYLTLKVYNILGQEVATLAQGYERAGSYRKRWNGCDNNGAKLTNGIYFIHMSTDYDNKLVKEYTSQVKVVLKKGLASRRAPTLRQEVR